MKTALHITIDTEKDAAPIIKRPNDFVYDYKDWPPTVADIALLCEAIMKIADSGQTQGIITKVNAFNMCIDLLSQMISMKDPEIKVKYKKVPVIKAEVIKGGALKNKPILSDIFDDTDKAV